MYLTKNFQSEEFYVSDSRPDLVPGILRLNEDAYKLLIITNVLLQPLRDVVGPLRILSGKRSPELNSAVGGEPTSDHLYFNETCAVDFTTLNGDIREAWNWLQKYRPNCYGQLILYTKSRFVHASLPSFKHVGQAWEWDK